MKESLKLGIILFFITALCAGLLGLINNVTSPVISQNIIDSQQQAMKMLVQEAEVFEQVENLSEDMIKEVYIAKTGGIAIGTVVKVMPNGYGGTIAILVGLNLEAEIQGIKILSHTETPGFGANATKENFTGQFLQKVPPLSVVKSAPEADDIVALTGATITSDAIVEGVNQAAKYVLEHQAVLTEGGN